MATEFNDAIHKGLFMGGDTLRSGNAFSLRQSELTLAALRAAGVLDNMEDGIVPPETDHLWLDKNSDPAVLKKWDPTALVWEPVTFESLFKRGVDYYVDTRTDLKKINTSKDTVVTLKEAGREGAFFWRTGNYSAQITADTFESIYVKANAIAATAGAWVRQGGWAVSGVDLGWSGVVPGGNATAAIQAANNLGLTVQLFKGDIRVNSTINLTNSVGIVSTHGLGGSRILVGHATADIFNLAAHGAYLSGFQIVSEVARTAGYYINVNNVNWCRIEDMYLDGHYRAIHLQGSVGTRIERNVVGGGVPATTVAGGCTLWADGSNINTDCHFRNNTLFAVLPANMPSYGLVLKHTDAFQMSDNDIMCRGISLLIAPDTGQHVSATKSSNNYYDSATEGVRFAPNGGVINRGTFDHDWSASHTGPAWRFGGGGTISGIRITGAEALLSSHGFLMEASAGIDVDLQLIGCVASGNTGGGFTALDGAGGFTIIGGIYGATNGIAGNLAGISINGTTHDNYQIIGCDLRGNTNTPFFNEGPAPDGVTRIVRNCLGYVNRNRGSTTIAVGQSAVTVTHGLNITPLPAAISVTAGSSFSASGISSFYVVPGTISSTTFQIACNTAVAGVAMAFNWQVN